MLSTTIRTTVEEFAGALIPVYPATKDLRSWQIANVDHGRCSTWCR